jgi:hypothetical protein
MRTLLVVSSLLAFSTISAYSDDIYVNKPYNPNGNRHYGTVTGTDKGLYGHVIGNGSGTYDNEESYLWNNLNNGNPAGLVYYWDNGAGYRYSNWSYIPNYNSSYAKCNLNYLAYGQGSSC